MPGTPNSATELLPIGNSARLTPCFLTVPSTNSPTPIPVKLKNGLTLLIRSLMFMEKCGRVICYRAFLKKLNRVKSVSPPQFQLRMSTPFLANTSRGSLAMNTSNVAFARSFVGMPQPWWCAPTNTPRESVDTFQHSPVRPACTKLVSITSSAAKMTAPPATTFISKVMLHPEFMRAHFLKVA